MLSVVAEARNLASKMFAVGYMLHGFKSPSRAWAPFAMDAKVGENGECNGRSGKSFLFSVLGKLLRRVLVSGRGGRKVTENPHLYEQVSRYTDFVLVDDLDANVGLDAFYDLITTGMTINPKNQSQFTLSFEESPKFAFTTNYVPKSFDASTTARLLPLVFSDYYHERTLENGYLESRSVRDDFGRDLYTDEYPADDWNADLNFLLQCLQFYLDVAGRGEKILPPMAEVIERKYKAEMSADFQAWAEVYFSEEGVNVNRHVSRKEAFTDFLSNAGGFSKSMSSQKFMRSLKAFCFLCPYIYTLNPEELKNAQGRIIRKGDDGKIEEKIFVQTKQHAKDQRHLESTRGDSDVFSPDEYNDVPF